MFNYDGYYDFTVITSAHNENYLSRLDKIPFSNFHVIPLIKSFHRLTMYGIPKLKTHKSKKKDEIVKYIWYSDSPTLRTLRTVSN